MLINEVEYKVGLSKKSIRYYEENGLLKPKRNEDNDYRVYSDDDIRKLRVIKFLRELGVSINELKKLNNGEISLQECMNERLRMINSEEEKYQKVKTICLELSKSDKVFSELNVPEHFEKLNILNKEGFTMRNTNTNKNKKIVGAIVSSIIFGCLILFVPMVITYFQFTESEKIPWILYWGLMLFFLLPVSGIVYNLILRIKEINRGEEDEASKY